MKVELQPAYLLFTRPYRESSLLLDLFSHDHGRVSAILKGGRNKRWRGIIREFAPMLVSWSGKGELKTLLNAELTRQPIPLSSQHLFGAMYVNELLYRLLKPLDAHERLFAEYAHCLDQLSRQEDLEATLRRFEWVLLDELGYGLDCHNEAGTELRIESDKFYIFEAEKGFLATDDIHVGVDGTTILAMAAGQWQDAGVKKHAKRIMRSAIGVHLGHKPLKSRELFKQQRSPR